MNLRVPFWASLRARVMIGVILPLTIILAAAAQVQIASHRELMLENLEQFSLSVGLSAQTALTRAMQEGNDQALAEFAHDLAPSNSVRRVMILDSSGRVRVASNTAELGTSFAIAGDAPYSYISTDPDGSRSLRSVTPLENRPACQTCHAAAARLNGALVIDLPYDAVEAHLRADLIQSLLVSAAAVLLVSLAINVLLSRIVISKLERFRACLADFGRGDLSQRVPVTGNDEIAELAVTVNAMADGLADKAKLESQVALDARELALRSSRLTALYRVALESSRSLDLNQVMRAGLESALAVTEMEAGEIRLDGSSGEILELQSYLGPSEEFAREEERILVGECLCGRVMQRGEVLALGRIGSDPQVTRQACRRYGYCALAAVPLQAHGRPVGVLSLHSRMDREFSPDDRALLKALGEQLGIAIDNARLYSQMEQRVSDLSRRVQHLAVTEERVRLAREMHDGLAQALSVLNLKLNFLRERTSDSVGFGAEIDDMQKIVCDTYEDVRQVIGDLRTPLNDDGKIVGQLVEYVQNFALRYELQARIEAGPEALAMSCPPEASPQVLRIVQEIMTNVRKHARALHIVANFERVQEGLRIRLQDDGEGFEAASVAPRDGHFGLVIMRERAASFGGELRIDSTPGQGTRVTLTVPASN